ncbi:MAG TPA: hypothetical protein VLT58_06565 [Polyangia bacterium]|nr:hypothetical protein [Polyangia bacterium]
MTNRGAYIARINRVVDHIDERLDADLALHTPARVARVSPWHFHRVFQALTGQRSACS